MKKRLKFPCCILLTQPQKFYTPALEAVLDVFRKGGRHITAAAALVAMGRAARSALPEMVSSLMTESRYNATTVAAMGAIDLDRAISLMEQDLDNRPGPRSRKEALKALLVTKDDVAALRSALSSGTDVKWNRFVRPFPFGVNFARSLSAWSHLQRGARALRPGDPLERVVALLRRPVSVVDGELIYREGLRRPDTRDVLRGFVVSIEKQRVTALKETQWSTASVKSRERTQGE